MSDSKVKIVPTVMPTDYKDFVEKIKKVSRHCDWIQIDVMDGKFVPSKSWPYNSPNDREWKDLVSQNIGLPHWEKNNFEIDLMVLNQVEQAEKWIEVGVSRIIGHFEAFQNSDEINRFIALGRDRGVEIYLALAPQTSNDALNDWLEKIDGVQFMGIEKVGFQGQEFAPVVLEKIADLRKKKIDLPISIDGGVSLETVRDLVNAGANQLSSGSYIFESQDVTEAFENLYQAAS